MSGISGFSGFVVDSAEDSIAVSMTKRIWQNGSMGEAYKVAKNFLQARKLLLI